MKPKTVEYFTAADRHRVFARALFERRFVSASLEWSMVAAFYSAVHYVNAYLWETYAFEPLNHSERTLAVRGDAALVPIAISYDALRTWGFLARYRPTFRPPDALIQRALQHLEHIRSIIVAEIGS